MRNTRAYLYTGNTNGVNFRGKYSLIAISHGCQDDSRPGRGGPKKEVVYSGHAKVLTLSSILYFI
jgi:hypothetical protein